MVENALEAFSLLSALDVCCAIWFLFVLEFFSLEGVIFLTSKFSYLLVSIPTHKTKTRTANRWKTTNSKAPGPIIMIGQSETGSRVGTYLLHSSQAGVRLRCSFTSLSKGCRNAWPKPFCSAELACFDFSSSNETVQGPIESNGGLKVGNPLKLRTH
jgi:hypothetical protein